MGFGKNYDAWQTAQQAVKAADNRVNDVSGGSTEQAYKEAQVNRQQAAAVEDEAFRNFIANPED